MSANGQIYSASLSIEADVTVMEEDALGIATHSANGLTYDQLNMQVSGNPVLPVGTVITISIPSIYMPLNTKPVGAFVLYTAADITDTPNAKIETSADGSGSILATSYFMMV